MSKFLCNFCFLVLFIISVISYIFTEDIPVDNKSGSIKIESEYVDTLAANLDSSNKIKRALPYRVGNFHMSLGSKMNFELKSSIDENVVKLSGELGMDVPQELGRPSFCKDSLHCLSWKSKIKLMIKRTNNKCYIVIWKSAMEEPLMDCISFGNDNWYGGPEHANQYWPVEELDLEAQPYISQESNFMSVSERYWLTSSGVYIYVDETVPLFVDTNFYKKNSICFIANDSPPYLPREHKRLKYRICEFSNPRIAHEYAIENVLKTPKDIPDTRMVEYPIWSTWVKFQQNVNDKGVLNYANNITKYGFNHSQIEIDDNWETCYGSKEFNTDRFSNVTDLIAKLKLMNFRVTLWTHPFINANCDLYKTIAKYGFFAKNHKGYINTKWWNGHGSVIDFTNNDAVEWFMDKHFRLLNSTGIDGFKFDAGETSWLPQVTVLNSTYIKQPQIYSKIFAETAAKFGKMTEVRVGHKTQHLPVFLRMLDKDSRWTFDNGLPTLISTLLVLNMVGYYWVLPDMIGGNGYDRPISKELFIRWLQVNTFMPALQFSAAPFDFDNETIEISKKFTSLRYSYSKTIIDLMKKSVKTGAPLNPPIWWVDPKNPTAHHINSEFLLGEDILIAPVLEEGAVHRDIYLPQGMWRDENNPKNVYSGHHWLRNYPADIQTLPYFTRVNITSYRSKNKMNYAEQYEVESLEKETYF